MQHVVDQIFETLGGSTAIATGVNLPIQTVNDWKSKGKPEIPPWRRADVLSFARSAEKLTELTPEALAYLQSEKRTVGRSIAA